MTRSSVLSYRLLPTTIARNHERAGPGSSCWGSEPSIPSCACCQPAEGASSSSSSSSGMETIGRIATVSWNEPAPSVSQFASRMVTWTGRPSRDSTASDPQSQGRS